MAGSSSGHDGKRESNDDAIRLPGSRAPRMTTTKRSVPWDRESRSRQLSQMQLQELVAGAAEVRVGDGRPVERAFQEQPVDQRLQAARDLSGVDTALPLLSDFADEHRQ